MKTKILLIALLALPGINVIAATAKNTTKATAQLAASCTIRADSVNFGELSVDTAYTNISKWGQIKSVTNNVVVLCNNKQSYKISGPPLITKGSAVGYYLKASTDASQMLAYNVYSNPDLSNGWFGDGRSYSSYGVAGTISSTGTGAEKTHPLYFGVYRPTIFPGYWPKPDTYSDTYTLTLTY